MKLDEFLWFRLIPFKLSIINISKVENFIELPKQPEIPYDTSESGIAIYNNVAGFIFYEVFHYEEYFDSFNSSTSVVILKVFIKFIFMFNILEYYGERSYFC